MKALITGASSGIGEAFAKKFAQLGYDLILTGRNHDSLEKLSLQIRGQYPVNVETVLAELASDADVEMLKEKILGTDDLHVLVNNAGFGSYNCFVEEDFAGMDKMIKVHVRAPLRLMHAALPQMIERGGGILINVSSLGGKTPFPKNSVYSATKSFLQVFSESLYLETYRSNILIQTLCPGFTQTRFHERQGIKAAGFKSSGLMSWMTPDEVVEISLKNLRKGKILCVPGFWNKALWVVAGLLPRSLYYSMVKAVERNVILKKGLAQV